MKFSLKVCTTYFPAFSCDFLVSTVFYALKSMYQKWQNWCLGMTFIKIHTTFLPFKYTALHHTHFQYENIEISILLHTIGIGWSSLKFITNHKVLRFFSPLPQVPWFPHCPHYIYIVSDLDCGLARKPEHELSKVEPIQVLLDVWTWYWHEICHLLFLARLMLLVRMGHVGELRSYKCKN